MLPVRKMYSIGFNLKVAPITTWNFDVSFADFLELGQQKLGLSACALKTLFAGALVVWA